MAQHDYIIDNQTSASLRADLNNALAAIVSQNSGATAPSTTYANQFWYDTTSDQLKQRNESNSLWITLGTVDQTNNKFEPNQTFSTQAEAEAGSENTKAMTALRTSQAISALGTRMQKIGGISLNGLSLAEFTGIPSNANTVILTLNVASMNTQGHFLVQLGTAGGYVASGSTSLSALGGTTAVVASASNQLIWNDSAGHNAVGKMVFTKFEVGGAEAWVQNSAFLMSGSNIQYGSGSVVLSAPLTKLKVYTSAGAFDGGAAYLWWEA